MDSAPSPVAPANPDPAPATGASPTPAPSPLRVTLPAVALLLVGVAGAVVARALRPAIPEWQLFTGIVACASLALLLPSFRRLAAVDFLYEYDAFFMTGVAAALVWANLDHAGYEAITHPLHFVVDDVLMALFFALAAKEVFEAILPGGPLASLRKAATPLVATAGGMLGPALLYAGACHLLGRPELLRGWAIPTATDIAFSALVARFVFGAKHPAIPFLLLLAIADDAGGLAILAVAYPPPDKVVKPLVLVGLVGLGIGVGLLLNKVLRVRSPWPYLLLAGVPSWLGFELGGLHPALGLVPIVPTLPHAAVDSGIFRPEAGPPPHSTLHRFEEALAAPVALVLGLFGLVSAGVPLAGVGTPTWVVLASLLVGKPVGITVATLAGERLGLAIPEGIRRRDVLVLGVAAGIGFTVALFVAGCAFVRAGDAATLDAAKMGALLSIGAAPLALALGRLLGVERRS